MILNKPNFTKHILTGGEYHFDKETGILSLYDDVGSNLGRYLISEDKAMELGIWKDLKDTLFEEPSKSKAIEECNMAELRVKFKPKMAELALTKLNTSIKEASFVINDSSRGSGKTFALGRISAMKEAREMLLDMFREESE